MKIYDSCKKLFDGTSKLVKDDLKDKYRIDQINLKIDHSYRTVDIISDLFDKFNCFFAYKDLAQGIMILHDYGRLDQMFQTGTYCDSVSFKDINEISDHGEYGAFLLFEIGDIKRTCVDEKYYDVFFNSIFYHAKKVLPNYLNRKVDESLIRSDLDSFLKSKPILLKSFYSQAVRDADKLDIYNQVILNLIPSFYDYISFDVKNIDYITNKLGISNSLIKEYTVNNKIKIPIDIIDTDKLKISNDFYEKFYNNNLPQLKYLFKMPWYNSFYAGLVRLNFIRDINFKASLKYIKKYDLLNRMYDMYPDTYKFIVKDAFEFTDDYINKKIKTKSIYCR